MDAKDLQNRFKYHEADPMKVQKMAQFWANASIARSE
jgi:hypothetical protein